jgi:hypothetical protein
VGRESYGFGRCSVLAITGVFKFLLYHKNNPLSRGAGVVGVAIPLAWAGMAKGFFVRGEEAEEG